MSWLDAGEAVCQQACLKGCHIAGLAAASGVRWPDLAARTLGGALPPLGPYCFGALRCLLQTYHLPPRLPHVCEHPATTPNPLVQLVAYGGEDGEVGVWPADYSGDTRKRRPHTPLAGGQQVGYLMLSLGGWEPALLTASAGPTRLWQVGSSFRRGCAVYGWVGTCTAHHRARRTG